MDLTTHLPRNPYDMSEGIVMLPRTMDKCRALLADKLGVYLYNCPLDQELFEFLGLDAERFTQMVRGCAGDAEVATHIHKQCSRSASENDAFNNRMRHLRPQDTFRRLGKWIQCGKRYPGEDCLSPYTLLEWRCRPWL